METENHNPIQILIFTIIGLSILIIISWFSLDLFNHSGLCHSKDITTIKTFGRPTFSPDGKEIAFLGYKGLFRQPVGICTFPDGGTPLTVSQKVSIFTMDIESGKINKVSSFDKFKSNVVDYMDSSYPAGVTFAWVDGSIY